jgi:hypothetical protein
MIRGQKRHAAFADPVEHQQRAVVAPVITDVAGLRNHVDLAQPAAPIPGVPSPAVTGWRWPRSVISGG